MIYYLVHNLQPELDPDRIVTERFDDVKRALRYAQRLNADRVEVIRCEQGKTGGEYVARYPLSMFPNGK